MVVFVALKFARLDSRKSAYDRDLRGLNDGTHDL